MDVMSEELKPCPFCGGEAAAVNGGGEWFGAWWCRCLTCEAATLECQSEASAVAAWNTRASAPEMTEALEGCPLPASDQQPRDFYRRFYDWYEGPRAAALAKARGR